MRPFTFPGLSNRVIFGSGSIAQAAAEIDRFGDGRRALILSTARQEPKAQALAQTLGPRAAGVFAGAAMHTPVEVTENALAAFHRHGADTIVSLGGGSTIGLGKAIALRTDADQVAIPTTYAGSELTDIVGETADGQKTTRRDPRIRPETVIYDPDLTLDLPMSVTVPSALNALAHVVESLYAPDRNPISDMLCRGALAPLHDGLPALVRNPRDAEARAQVLYAAWLCSGAFGGVSLALHHKLCHVLGGSFGMPHAETHAILLPHTAGFNAVAAPDLLTPVAEVFGDPISAGLWEFSRTINAPMALRDIGFDRADIARAADIASQNPYANPRPFDSADISALLEAAWAGARPSA
jgi:maleylacetate reductase